jgi:starvation-inducible DNA-binding protein
MKTIQIDPKVGNTLNSLLATAATLYFKTKKAHWLVSGQDFKELHELLDDQATFILASIDELAERVTMLGGLPYGSLQEFREAALIQDFPQGRATNRAFLETLLEDHTKIVLALRAGVDEASQKSDPGSADLFTRLVQSHEKAAWFIRETLQKE